MCLVAMLTSSVGCHPTRWVYELLNNDFTVCDLFERARQLTPDDSRLWEHTHRLVMNGNQSFMDRSSKLISALCLDCHFHFVFKMKWDENHSYSLCNSTSACWPLPDDRFPWHHLVWVGSDSDASIAQDHSKHYPLLARENFVCSAPPCTFQVTLEVSQPRMAKEWTQILLDYEGNRKQLEIERLENPERFEDAKDEWTVQAPLNLNTYLKNQLESTPETTRSISKRNKRFCVTFGTRSFPMFRGLGFDEKIEMINGYDDGSFTPSPPSPPEGPNNSTELGTYRAYIEDVRAEVQSLIHRGTRQPEPPSFMTDVLYADLGCVEVTGVDIAPYVKTERYKLLGVLPGQSREIVTSAYRRQWDLMPSRRRDLVMSLMAIAHDSQDDYLSDYAIAQSSLFESQEQAPHIIDEDNEILQSLAYLGLKPPNRHGADDVIQAFRQKLAKAPGEASTARNVLMTLAQGSNDDMYQAKLLMETDTKMSLDTARAILGVDSGSDNGVVAVQAARDKVLAAKTREEKEVLLDALDSIAEHTSSHVVKHSVMELRHAYGTYGAGAMTDKNKNGPVDFALPVGLDNIGNTCYLNSLLQYLYTVEPVREVVLGFDEYALGLNDDYIEKRRIGGNKMQMDRGEAVVARAFAQELAKLFQTLKTSDKSATRPSQRLANAVLLSTHTLLSSAKNQRDVKDVSDVPPPPGPPPKTQVESEADDDTAATDVTMLDIPAADTDSISSSQTLIDADGVAITSKGPKPTAVVDVAVSETKSEEQAMHVDAKDTNMSDTDSSDVDQKVLTALEHQKRSSGTDQQDVEEVMGSIINRLQAAIRPSSIDESTGIQLEKIMETFFVTTVNYTKKFDDSKYQQEISFDRALTAFPAPEGPCSLYDALGRNFDQQILAESKLSRYTAIKTLPPILHILIQRTQSTGSKNGNAVVIPETLYLDRYMDKNHSSPAFKSRVEDWVITDRIADIKSQLAKIESNPPYLGLLESGGQQSKETLGAGAIDADLEAPVEIGLGEENWDFDGPVDDDFVLISNQSKDTGASWPPLPIRDVRETHESILQMMQDELKMHQDNLSTRLEGEKEIAYRLHAVICHRGHLTSGHYWVWIRDFQDGVWRWYNDADVKENKDTEEVLKTLSTGGEPYFLCYVRDEDKDKYVSVPKRDVPEPVQVEEPTPAGPELPGSPPGLVADEAPADIDERMDDDLVEIEAPVTDTTSKCEEPSLLD